MPDSAGWGWLGWLGGAGCAWLGWAELAGLDLLGWARLSCTGWGCCLKVAVAFAPCVQLATNIVEQYVETTQLWS